MFCTNCGKNVNEGMAFCTNCGNKMQPASAVPQPVQQPTPVVPQQAAPMQQPTPVMPQQAAPVQQPTPVMPQQAAPVQQPTPVMPQQAAPVQQAPVMPQQAAPVQQAPVMPQQAAPVQQPTPIMPQQAAPNQAAAYGQPIQSTPVAPQQAVPNQPAPSQATPQPAAPGQPAQPKKKKNLGLILGLAIGIPTLIIAAIVVVIFTVVIPKLNEATSIVTEKDDDDDDEHKKPDKPDKPDPDPVPEPDPVVDPDPVTVPEVADRTIMMYIVGSTLESPEEYGARGGAATEDIYEMLAANIPEGVNVVLECGGSYEWEYPTVPDGAVSRHYIENNELVMLENLGRTTMTQYGDLTDFINFAATNYPAEKYTLLLWDHGGSIPISFGMDQLGDENDLMTDAELKVEIENSGIHFDSVIFDACNMCSLEIGMALEDSADYMVGAESYVNGIGIYYTNWLGETNGDVRDFCETIVEDYMDSLEQYNLVGSMSVIRLDRIREVYNAYEAYIDSVNYYIYGASGYHDFSNYIKARGNCGQYYGTDSVDLTTLANKYETDKSSALINSVSNAVVYTRSDMPYGHGITAYSPYDYFHIYDIGRPSLVTLNYSDKVIGFYDHLVSEMLSNYGSDVVAAYAGDWFIDDYDIAAAGTSDDIGQLTVSDMGNYYAVPLSNDDWEVISTIATAVVVETDDGTDLVLGQDYQYMLDDYDYVAIVDPEYWYYLNGNIATFYATSDYYDETTGAWSRTGYIPVTVNGLTAALYIYFDQNNPYGLIQGYYYFNYQTLSRDDNTMYMISADQEFDLYYPCLDENENPYYLENGDPIRGDELNLELYYINLNSYTTYGYIEIVDVYGNKYQTEHYYLGSRDSVD